MTLRKKIKLLRIFKKELNINIISFKKNIEDFIDFFIKGFFAPAWEWFLSSIFRIAGFILTSFLVSCITATCISIPVYMVTPAIFNYFAEKIGINIYELNLHERLIIKENIIFEQENSLINIKEDNNLKSIELRKIYGERDGIIEGIKKVQLEKTNWWNIIFTISGITLIGGATIYLLFSGSDAEFFKPILKSIGSGSDITNNLVGESTKQINDNLIKTFKKIENLETVVTVINNSISSIIKDIEKLIKND